MSAAVEIEGLSHRFVEANGLRFHVAECGAGERLALCLHGFPELWYSWRHQMPLLAKLGYRVWAPDLRGYGQSERPPRRRGAERQARFRRTPCNPTETRDRRERRHPS